MAVCPSAPALFFIPTPWDGPLYWVVAVAASGVLAVFWLRVYRRFVQAAPPERQRVAIGLYSGYMLALLIFALFDVLVLMPSLDRQHAWFQNAIENCSPGSIPGSNYINVILTALGGAGLITAAVCFALSRLNRRLGLPTWNDQFR